jgi:aspartate/methionine/tyrosine aminotransferase
MGVIWVVDEAMKRGFRNLDPNWCNLGQGMPEIGPIEGAPERLRTIDVAVADLAYGPVGGIDALRERVAEHYNRLFRSGKRSKYRKENVGIAAGGRLMLSRLIAALGSHNLGHVVPDYTAYEDLLDYHRYRIKPIAIETTPDTSFHIPASAFETLVRQQALGSFLISNSCNPTGNIIEGEELSGYVHAARKHGCFLLFDEFYSHFIVDKDGAPGREPVSAASVVDDVDRDPVVLVDGLTKNYRYPGLRVGWILGPSAVIEQVTRTASAIDGGPPVPIQQAAARLLEPDRADQETTATRAAFAKKRQLMMSTLGNMGIDVQHTGRGTFYIWASLRKLASPLDNADAFFRAALDKKVMTVPGRFFDVNPGRARSARMIDETWTRFSFGPPIDNVRLGLDRLRSIQAAGAGTAKAG